MLPPFGRQTHKRPPEVEPSQAQRFSGAYFTSGLACELESRVVCIQRRARLDRQLGGTGTTQLRCAIAATLVLRLTGTRPQKVPCHPGEDELVAPFLGRRFDAHFHPLGILSLEVRPAVGCRGEM